ncbi:DUF4350 domain-containing protein [Halorientalis litorea]|uniref:DUF4350 domain-containing protein n=1 Tax=Halorientalis litorea TaxID=2931977 RepID=UPI001FF3C9E6|nr:DUF4350 domain-containing protein [Halorientalis litorea]
MADRNRLGAVFTVVLVVVLVAAALGPLVTASGGSDERTVSNTGSFDPQQNLVTPSAEDGSVTVEAEESGKVVLIDAAHANAYSQSDLAPLVDALVRNGHEVRFHGSPSRQGRPATSLNESLRPADAYVVVSPASSFTPSERAGVADFADRGGRVLMLGEPQSIRVGVGGGGLLGISVQQVQSQLTGLASQFGMDVGTPYLFNMEDNANNFKSVYATPPNASELTDGVDRVVLRQSTAVTAGSDATVALSAVEGTALSSTRETDTYTVAARNDDVVVMGDSSFLTPENYRTADNEVLVGNIADFLVSGDKRPKPQQSADGTSAGSPGSTPPVPRS